MEQTVKGQTISEEKITKIMKRRQIRKRVTVPQQKIQNPPFTKWEDQRILELVLELGPRFQEIHKHIPNRTLTLVKNRYYKYLRYNWNTVLGKDYSKEQIEDQADYLQFQLENAGLQIEFQDILSSLLQKMSRFFSEL